MVCDLIDVYRNMFPNGRSYTRTKIHKNQFAASRLDRFYVARLLTRYCESVDHETVGFSDHKLVSLILDIDIRNQTHWIFNNNLLKLHIFNSKIIQLFESFKSNRNQFESIAVWWDTLKKCIQIETQELQEDYNKYCKNNLSAEIEYIERLIPSNPAIIPRYNQLKLKQQQTIRQASVEKIAMQTKSQSRLMLIKNPFSIILTEKKDKLIVNGATIS